MVVLNKIYTRTGDKGSTSLGDGAQVKKFDLRVTSYGTADELNAYIGVARLNTVGHIDAQLAMIQNELFDIGADLCRPQTEDEDELEYPPLRLDAAPIDRLEREIDAMTKELEPLTSFILPGGTALAAQLHVCRTVTRRVERLVVELASQEPINDNITRYLNRLSDWFFTSARMANDQGRADVLWKPGASRKSENNAT